MIYPSMASLLKKVDSRYTLVIAASKRARMLTEGAQKLTDTNSPKDVTIAIHEISEGKVGYHRIHRVGMEEETFVTESVTMPRPAWESKRLGVEEEADWSDEELLDEEHESEEDEGADEEGDPDEE